uniref:SSD domain-containing protein n=1 Tax=Macrostomum lignano TaxID=282301 RepID=A0A1I8F7I6_9PLAT
SADEGLQIGLSCRLNLNTELEPSPRHLARLSRILLSFAFFSSMALASSSCTWPARYQPPESQILRYPCASARVQGLLQPRCGQHSCSKTRPGLGPFLTAQRKIFQTSPCWPMLAPAELSFTPSMWRLQRTTERFHFIVDLIQFGLANVSATLMLAYEICQLVLMYNQTAREMSSMIAAASNFGFCITFCMAVCGTGSLVKICLLIYGLSIIVYFWMCLQIRFLFVMEEPKTHFAAWQLKSFETRREQAMSTPDTLLYEANIICSLLAAPLLHTASRLDQTGTQSTSPLIRRFPPQASLCPRFPTQHSSQVFVCTARAKEGCDQVAAGISCHYGMLSKAMTSHASLKALYLSLIFYRACWLGGVKVVATAHAATRSRMMRSFVELCLIGQRWAHMTRWRRQNASSCSGAAVALTWCTLLFCLDNLPLDPSALKVQFANYLILDLRFMIFLNATLLGLIFRRLSRSVLYWILALCPCCCTPTRSCDTLRYKLMTPIYKSHAAWLRRNCSKKIRLRPVINVGQRIVDHEVLHLADSDAFYYPTIVGLTWCLAALASCLRSAGPISKSIGNFAAALPAASAAPAARNPCLWRRLSKKCATAATAAAADASASTGGTGHNVHRRAAGAEKYTREETELVLSSLAEAGLRQRLIDGSRRTSAFSPDPVGDMLTGDTLRYKLMTPIYKSARAWAAPDCSKKIAPAR